MLESRAGSVAELPESHHSHAHVAWASASSARCLPPRRRPLLRRPVPCSLWMRYSREDESWRRARLLPLLRRRRPQKAGARSVQLVRSGELGLLPRDMCCLWPQRWGFAAIPNPRVIFVSSFTWVSNFGGQILKCLATGVVFADGKEFNLLNAIGCCKLEYTQNAELRLQIIAD